MASPRTVTRFADDRSPNGGRSIAQKYDTLITFLYNAVRIPMTSPTPTNGTQGAPASGHQHGINLIGLIALVISSSIGSGVFALSTDISAAAAPGPAIIAWLITGLGFMMLAGTFGRLSIRRPDLDGIVAYAREGFGPFIGFISGWGYWLSIWIGNVAFGVMLITAIGYFYPPFAGQLTLAGVAVISLINWAMIALVNRGVEEASVINAIVMVCKLVPIFAFIAMMLLVFSFDVFTADFWGTLANNMGAVDAPGSVSQQIINCFMVMMWVFVGMEGASVLGHRAERKRDVSRATILGTTALVIIYVSASVLPYGFMTREELMALSAPSMPYIFAQAVGPWGGAFISGGLIISIFGAWLSYTILASEAMQGMARMQLLPATFAKTNAHGAPTSCLLLTGIMIQVLAIVMLFSEAAYEFAYSLCTAAIVISWSLAALYMVRYARSETYAGRMRDAGIAAFAVVFLVVAIILAGLDLLALCCIAYIPGIYFYIRARRELGAERILGKLDRVVAVLILLVGIGMIAYLAYSIATTGVMPL